MMTAEKLNRMVESLRYNSICDIKSRTDVEDIVYYLMNSLPEGYEDLSNALDKLYQDIENIPTEDIVAAEIFVEE